MHVRQPFQRQGIGAALLSKAMEALEQRGCRTSVLWTLKDNAVRAWYDRIGSPLNTEKSWEVDGWPIVAVAYRLGVVEIVRKQAKRR